MPDDPNTPANGRHDPAVPPLDPGTALLANRWDGDALARRSRTNQRTALPVGSDPTVDRLSTLATTDPATAPQPGFLDDLEARLMTTHAMPSGDPVRDTTVRPASRALIRPLAVRRRAGRGLIDMVALAALLALVVVGGWYLSREPAAAPTPDVSGVAGVATPDVATPAAAMTYSLPVLEAEWAQPLPDSVFGGALPVDTGDCTAPYREPGSAEAAIQRAVDDGSYSSPAPDPVLSELAETDGRDWERYPDAGDSAVVEAQALLDQLAMCRYELDGPAGPVDEPVTGRFFSLLSDQILVEYGRSYLSYNFNPASTSGSAVSDVLPEIEVWIRSVAAGFASIYPGQVLDARELPPDADGNARLLVRVAVGGTSDRTSSLVLSREGAGWRLVAYVGWESSGGTQPAPQLAEVLITGSAAGPGPTTEFSSQLEADTPVSLTFVNTADDAQVVMIDGQSIGDIAGGHSLTLQPFVVPGAAMAAAEGRLTFTVTTAPTADPAAVSRPYSISVYPAGTLPRPGAPASAATPAPGTPTAGTPAPAAAATPTGAMADIGATPPVAVDRIVTLDQPWASSTGDATWQGVAPVLPSECDTPSRESGAIIAIAEANPTRPAASLPPYLEPGQLDEFLAGGTDASRDDLAAAEDFLRQWSACWYEIGNPEVPVEDRYTAPAWSRFSTTFIARLLPESDGGRTAEARVRQLDLYDGVIAPAPVYPDAILDVRSWPVDGLGQRRLLVVSQDRGPGSAISVFTIVLEGGVWRLDEYATSVPSGDLATPGVATPETIIQIRWSVGAALAQLPLIYPLVAGEETAVAFRNNADQPVRLILGDQDLGEIAPGGTLLITPFVIPPEILADAGGEFTVPVVAIDADGNETPIRWPVLPPT